MTKISNAILNNPSIQYLNNNEFGNNAALVAAFKEILNKSCYGLDIVEKEKLLNEKRKIVEIFCNASDSALKKTELLKGANFCEVDFKKLDLTGLNLEGCKFRNNDFEGAIIRDVNLEHASFDNFSMNDDTVFDNNKTEEIKFLNFDDIEKLPITANEKHIVMGKEKIRRNNLPLFYTINREADLETGRLKGLNRNKVIKCFKDVLNKNVPFQARLKALDDVSLMLILPCFFVESSHKYNPIIAYDYPQIIDSTGNLHRDDYANLIKCYTHFLNVLNDIAEDKSNVSVDKRSKNLTEAIKFIAETIIEPRFGIFSNHKTRCNFDEKDLFDHGFLKGLVYKNEDALVNLTAIEEEITVEKCNDSNESLAVYLCRGVNKRENVDKEKILLRLSAKLLKAFDKKDKQAIFHLSSDLMYLHLFADGNGRISQVIRDCFAMHMGEPPYLGLRITSWYAYLGKEPDLKYLQFMQQNAERMLSLVEDGKLTPDACRWRDPQSIDRLWKAASEHPAIYRDVRLFLDATGLSDQPNSPFSPFPTNTP